MLVCGPSVFSLYAQTQVRMPAAPKALAQGGSISGGVAPGATAPLNAPSIGAPVLDPYATNPFSASSPPTVTPGAPSLPTSPSFGPTQPYSSSTPTPTWPSWTGPSGATPGSGFPSTGYPSTYSQQPAVLFPNGLNPTLGLSPSFETGWEWPEPEAGRYLRLFQDLRVRHTWLAGGDGARPAVGDQEVGVNQSEIGTTISFPNFLWSQRPLHVSPVFGIDLWDGPLATRGTFPTDDVTPPLNGGFGLPSRVYGTYVSFAWQPQFTPQFFGELEASAGVFSDFDGFTSDSIRVQGTGLGALTVTPTLTFKAGATYFDRVDVKLLPAGGIVWTPNPQTRWDIYFPRPKLARYLTTVGNTDVWFYLNGEYGGGSWTIGNEAVDRRMDMNDIRAGGGFEWTHQFGLQGFAEAAYVFDRELVFAIGGPGGGPLRYPLKDTVMVRGGFVY
jgi:hypothetical protein